MPASAIYDDLSNLGRDRTAPGGQTSLVLLKVTQPRFLPLLKRSQKARSSNNLSLAGLAALPGHTLLFHFEGQPRST